MIKFALGIVSAILVGPALAAHAAVPMADIKLNSHLGQAIMQHARRLDGGNDDNNNNNSAYNWVSNYSIKFQGCHHTLQYNMQADANEDVKIYNRRLARFRLCSSDSCNSMTLTDAAMVESTWLTCSSLPTPSLRHR